IAIALDLRSALADGAAVDRLYLGIYVITGVCILGVFGAGPVAFLTVRRLNANLGSLSEELGDASSLTLDASRQMADTSHTLAEGATQQAAGLEETAATLEEISAMTKQNTESIEQVEHLANEVEKITHAGRDAMTRMVGAIQEIKSASDKT